MRSSERRRSSTTSRPPPPRPRRRRRRRQAPERRGRLRAPPLFCWRRLSRLMEAASSSPVRDLAGDKAQRIIEAMRRSVARRGSAGSTFDHVAREAGVSRGLLHYYFGTKEQLLVEAVRRDGELRLQRLETQLSTAQTADDFIDLLVFSLEELVREDPDYITVVFEMFSLSQRND